MGTDKARRSYDATRMYRSVVSQQGRVTLEADANEAEEIRGAESRADLIDIIGPTGTPDDGFLVSVPGGTLPYDFGFAAGTIYLGGERVVQRAPGTYLGQSANEWADYSDDAPYPYPNTPLTELIFLLVAEQEVSATEDPALREIALGGPDTAARTRLVQRVMRGPSQGDCMAALQEIVKIAWPGLSFDPATYALAPNARLKVDFTPVPGDPDPCQPIAQPGFLGAENQLINIKVSKDNKLFWGYDNASFLYRATVQGPRLIALAGTPVDEFHIPRPGQIVELSRPSVILDADAQLAAAVGVAFTVASYAPDTNSITLTADLPAGATTGLQIFARVWENQLPYVGDGTTATELLRPEGTSTGVRVTTSGVAMPGDYWQIGVRPSNPQAILPARYLTAPQPPDGPLRWVTPLASIAWVEGGRSGTVHDCRLPFDNLVELTARPIGGCCEVKVAPGDDVQALVTAAIAANKAAGVIGLDLKFGPGTYQLERPITITGKGGSLTVSGCGLDSILNARGTESALRIVGWDTVRVSDLQMKCSAAGTGLTAARYAARGGVLTISRCHDATVERVVVTTATTGPKQGASGIAILGANTKNNVAQARVRGCTVNVGVRQQGVLLVHVTRATIEDNVVQLVANAPATETLPLQNRDILRDIAYRGHDSPTLDADHVVDTFQLWGTFVLRYVTHRNLQAAWQGALILLKPTLAPAGHPAGVLAHADRRRIGDLLSHVVAQILGRTQTGPLDAGSLGKFTGQLAAIHRVGAAVADSGIVVAGEVANDIRILHNTVSGAMSGIHVGLSARGGRKDYRIADRVQIVGNTVSARVPAYEQPPQQAWALSPRHAGIFVGNASDVTIRDNRVTIAGGAPVEGHPTTWWVDGIRVWGLPGAGNGHFLLVTGNIVRNAYTGILVREVGPAAPAQLARITENLLVNTVKPIDPPGGTVAMGPDNVPPP